jgi:hypothetical protein
MCQKPKPDGKNFAPEDDEAKTRSYYYDDAHGYEDFDPEADEIDSDEEDESA